MIDISIDMLSLENADSIIVWLKDDSGGHYVIVIDGGNTKDGDKVIDHLESFILPHTPQDAPDLIVSTHHDKDHIGGLIPVVEHYGNSINEVWVNNPAEYKDNLAFTDLKEAFKRKSENKQYKVILESLNNLEDFITIVDKHGIQRFPAIYGRIKHNGIIKILGPSEDFYKSLLPRFKNLEDFVTKEAQYAFDSIFGKSEINESLEKSSPCPIVDEENSTSATNNSSVILQIIRNGSRYLFTGDAGVDAFKDVESRGELNKTYWLDVPHHGSRRNLTSDLISTISPDVCYVSAEGSNKHPRRALINCLNKQNAKVYSTHKGGNKWHHAGNFPDRSSYSPAEEL